MFNRGNPIHDNLSLSERKEYIKLSQNLSKYVSDIDTQRKNKIKEVNHSLRPSDNDFFRASELWWKAFS